MWQNAARQPISEGSLFQYRGFGSRFVAPRTVEVWCPGGYDKPHDGPYPVVYMHDGQNIFSAASAFGGVSWGVHEAVGRLQSAGKIPGAIVVGIWSTESRWREYFPESVYHDPDFAGLRGRVLQHSGGEPVSDAYVRFVVEELKPFVDAHYRTRPEQPHTIVAGSSMGALISLNAISEYPQVFGGAGCLSTHWVAGGETLVRLMAAALPDPASHKLYFDFGTETADAEYEPWQQKMDAHLRNVGYSARRNWLTLKFEGADHSEKSWRERVDIPLAFLLS